MPKILDLTGQKFGMLTAVKITDLRSGTSYKWICKCDCGGEACVASNNLRTGHTYNCGCLTSELRSKNARSHNMSRTSEYKSWASMKDRCFNKSCESYPTYGGRGITIQESWINDFCAFFSYIGKKPFSGATVERIDNDGNYCEGNVKWSSKADQSKNKGMYRNNTTGVTGVNLIEKTAGCWSYVAVWVENGKQVNRAFSINKHGLLPAFAKAVQCREENFKRLVKNENYSEKHGKERKHK